MSQFLEAEFVGCNLRDVYFEDARIINPIVDYRTEFGNLIARSWENRLLPLSQLPDIYRVIRTAYELAELYHRADIFLYKERNAFRSHVLKSRLRAGPTVRLALQWLADALWDWTMGYGTKPFRILLIGPFLATIFALVYWGVGVPFVRHTLSSTMAEYAYFSITSFATLGYGDLAFGVEHPCLRLMSAGEAMLGATWVATFVAVLSRKLVR